MDLTKQPPRSPFAQLGGLNWVPRAIDKAKAQLAGTTGEYNYDCPMDQALFTHLGISGEDFLKAVETRKTDEAIWAWVQEHATQGLGETEKQAFNKHLLEHGPWGDPQKEAWFKSQVELFAPGRDVRTWAELIALEEKHPLPARA